LSGLSIFFNTNKENNNKIYDGNASLDRIDSSKGYVEDNVQWIHKELNCLKMDIPENKLIKWCELIYLHNLTKNE
jgi:hypothetical protein